MQGGYQRHADHLDRCGVKWCLVRNAETLARCAALILPGGESTAITRLLQAEKLLEPLRRFTQSHPVMATCAGLIMMARSNDARVESLNALDLDVARNAYGRQIKSFQCSIQIDLGTDSDSFPAVFIRAPQIMQYGPSVTVLAQHQGSPVLVAQGWHLGMTFHPELSDDLRVHRYWLERIAALHDAVVSQKESLCKT
ncbi:MAG: pyridoxal 5'-phosphate synthase glutaminase subunit PdxT [Gammaproteobacteria bacterium]|nr:pyridoxal 5'-phosphate synthase glutaminase subunit PdxT [Gammaproteobacteria bacterium]MBU2477621.1 pyridoxal 5'-phosphate synthase glutaminase subunit PdxT [Gammaproteobacteria bacterium]